MSGKPRISVSGEARVSARMLAPVLLRIGDVRVLVADINELRRRVHIRFGPGRSRPGPARHFKPHPSQAYKGMRLKFGGLVHTLLHLTDEEMLVERKRSTNHALDRTCSG